MLIGAGLSGARVGARVDVFAGAPGEGNARQFGTYGVPILAWRIEAASSRVDE